MTEGSRPIEFANGSISWREYIRWFPDAASEPTSTLVLTSPSRLYVDIRIFKPTKRGEPELPNEGGPMTRLEWAFAGTSSTELRAPTNIKAGNEKASKPILHGIWRHWIDSRAAPGHDGDTADEGELYPLPDGERTLERGAMVNPATGRKTEYEECWWDEADERSVVLRLEENGGKTKGMIVRVGRWCQGLIKVVHDDEQVELAVERWKFTEEGKWQRVVKLGRVFMPCATTWDNSIAVGGKIEYKGYKWEVVEVTGKT